VIDLFGKKPRRQPLRRAHVIDAGEDMAKFECSHCGWVSDWRHVESITEGKRGIPCESCNEVMAPE
jgi:NAD-dependent SIR2 family protein deacetylase